MTKSQNNHNKHLKMSVKNQEQQHEAFSSKISDEINCSICLDILVSPRSLVPCGHSFCRSCCSSDAPPTGRHRLTTLSFTKCPNCRHAIDGTVPSRQLESLIDTLVTVPNLLFKNDDDKQHYIDRRKIESDRSASMQVQPRTRKRPRQNEYHSQNYASAANPQVFHEPAQHHYRAHHGAGVSFQSATSFTTTTRAASFDPMIAPLPRPYDFSATGPVPVLSFEASGFERPLTLPVASRSRPPQIMARPTSTNGISASDPICLD